VAHSMAGLIPPHKVAPFVKAQDWAADYRRDVATEGAMDVEVGPREVARTSWREQPELGVRSLRRAGAGL
jgi:hypothetical protein